MPSFTRRVPSSAPPPLPTLIKTGIPSLDDLWHLPPGSTSFVFSPDVHSSWPRLIARYFLAQAFLAQEQVIVIGADEHASRDLVKGCMWVDERSTASASAKGKEAESGSEGEAEGPGEGEENRTRIAWRYGSMDKFKTSIGEKGQLNLSTAVPRPLLEQAERGEHLQYLTLGDSDESPAGPSGSSRSWAKISTVLSSLQAILAKADPKVTVRVVVNELGGAEWDDPPSHEVHRFLHSLKGLIRGRNAVAMITLPPAVARSLGEEGIKRLSWAVDASLELKGFADDPTLQPIFHPLHGLITLHSFPYTQLLPPTIKHSSLLGLSAGGGGSENNLGFRARRKRWGVETVHLGVEGGVGERRTEPATEVGRMVSATAVPAPAPAAEGPTEGIDKAPTLTLETTPAPKKKDRPRVRFGDDEVLNVSEPPAQQGGHSHSHQPSSHSHTHTPRATVRHDRPDLYEF